MSFNGALLEIFSWLSASILFKFSAVSKSSKKLLSESFFVRKQCKNMQRVPDSEFFIQPNYVQQLSSHNLEIHTLSAKDANSSRVPRESLEFLTKQSPIIASSNGLVCSRNLLLRDMPLFLFNPVTKNYLQIPFPCDGVKISYAHIDVIFDCNSTNDDDEGYFLMVLVPPPEFNSRLFSSMIYSPEKNIWRDGGEVDFGQRLMNFECPVREDRFVYMISDNSDYLSSDSPFYWPYIVAYDINNSSSTFLSLPEQAREGLFEHRTTVRIFMWGDFELRSICLVKLRNEVFTVWVLSNEDDFATRQWTRIFRMHVESMAKTDLNVAGFTVINGGVLLFASEEKVYSYDLKHGNKGEAKQVCTHKCGDCVQLRSYSSTLRPCGSSSAITLPLLSMKISSARPKKRKFSQHSCS